MRVLVLSLNGMYNYGNRLQNYAVNQILKEHTNKVDNLLLQDVSSSGKNLKNLIKRVLPRKIFTEKLHRRLSGDKLRQVRENRFMRFSKNYMHNIEVLTRSSAEIKRYIDVEKYEFVFVGSDQVWNPDFAGMDSYFLSFVEPQKRIAFSASIGYDSLPAKTLSHYSRLWKQMRYISVRENSAADIIEQQIGVRPDVFLDPTLLLQKKEWDAIVRKPEYEIPSNYVLCLFLGEIPEEVTEFRVGNKDINFIILNDKNYSEYYLTDPAEFLWLIKNAELVLTDSFHCTVFSIIYHKQFWVYKRKQSQFKDMFTRLETLLSEFDMMDRIGSEKQGEYFEIIDKNKFISADEKRNAERQKVNSILNSLFSNADL